MGTQLVAEGQISNEILSSILEKQEKLEKAGECAAMPPAFRARRRATAGR